MRDAHQKHDSHMKKCIWLDRYAVFSLFVLPEIRRSAVAVAVALAVGILVPVLVHNLSFENHFYCCHATSYLLRLSLSL